ncbi:hypothetical protein NUH86_24705 (plasmid) [Sphingobium sp. JS3065]|nr:hypothetical protein [Sphingobium sp. JS3065]UZW58264.1 hypothetical protein NUH86_24705 [Sphingobium sp. JS3065]
MVYSRCRPCRLERFNGLSIEGDGRHVDFDSEWSGDDYDYTDAKG